ncbi:MAG: FkbM family methyltransferase [Caldilineaceae bacterium]|nr:FkbM family methyltransferase [Caldilineaceae bacterium]
MANRFWDNFCVPALKKLGLSLIKASHLLERVGLNLYDPVQHRRVVPWFHDQGDKVLRLDYALGENSLVFDVGGYEGQWASDIFARYCCFIYIFEPVHKFAEQIEYRFKENKKIIVHKAGLADKNASVPITLSNDGSSVFTQGSVLEQIQLIKAMDFIERNGIKKIDLMKINIEGGEYDLLEHLIDSGFVQNIQNLQIQFHDFVPNAETRMLNIQQSLASTHELTYQYLFVWENWKLRN